MRVTQRSALTFAAAIIIILILAFLGATPARAAASYHCQHRVQDAVWSWTFNKESYIIFGPNPLPTRRHVRPETVYVTGQQCDNRYVSDRFRIKSLTYCLTDQNHASRHTGATFNAFFHLRHASTKVNPPAYRVEEDGSPEHVCERHGIPREDQRWMRWADGLEASVVTAQNIRFQPDPVTNWRTASGSTERRMYESDIARVGVRYWSGY
jgi:hypothetical protein